MAKKNLNSYVKNPKARFIIRIIAFIGYVILKIQWWVLYHTIEIIFQVFNDLKSMMEEFKELIEESIISFKQLHKKYSYFDMLLIAVGTIILLAAMLVVLYGLMFVFTLLIPTGY